MAKARTARRTIIDMAVRRQRPGYGSALSRLERDVIRESWWQAVETALAGVPHVVIGGVAANAYMAPRHTMDLAIGIVASALAGAEAALKEAGWRQVSPVQPTDPHLSGWTWASGDRHELDLLVMSHPWAGEALRQTRTDIRTGLPTLPVEYVVLMKLTVSRTIDLGDLARVLGARSNEELAHIRAAVRRYGAADDVDDLEQLIALGRMERDDRKA